MTGETQNLNWHRERAPSARFGIAGALASVVLLTAGTAAAGDLQASVDKQTVGVGQNLVLSLRMTSDGRQEARITARPDFGKFKALGSTQNTEFRSVNGRTTLVRSYRIQMKAPGTPGTYWIGGAEAVVGTAKVRSEPVSIRVLPADKLPKAAPNKRVLIRTEVSDREPYVGEQIRLNYDLLVDTRDAGPFGGVTLTELKEPPLDGFWIEDFGAKPTALERREVVNGREFSISSLKHLAVFPLNTGRTTLEPLRANLTLGGSSLFRRRKKGKNVALESEAVTLNVRPLPAGAPDGFHPSNVGTYTFNLAAEQARVKVGEPVTITLKVYGKGMYSRTRLPEFPKNEERYRLLEPVSRKNPVPNVETVAGEHVVEYVLTPKKLGALVLPSLEFHFFDPQSETYRTVKTKELTLAVIGVAAKVGDETTIEEREEVDEPEAVKVAKRPLVTPRPIGDAPSEKREPVFTHALFLFGLLFPAFAYAGVIVAGRVRRRQKLAAPKRKRAQATQEAGESLREMDGKPDDEVYAAIHSALTLLLETKLGRAALGQRESSLKEMLVEAGASPACAEEVICLRRACDAARFGAAEIVGSDALIRARKVIGGLEAQL